MTAALLFGLALVAPSAAEDPVVAPYLEAVPLAPEGCRVAASDAQVVIDCKGTALLVAPSDGSRTGLLELLDQQVAPFAQAGMPVSDPAGVLCHIQGVAGQCVERTVSVPGADAMSVLGGIGADGSFAALCLRRGAGVGDPCAEVVAKP